VFVPYSPGNPSGIGVYSKIPLHQHETENLAWEAGKNATEKAANRKAWIESFSNAAGFDRPYARFEGTFQGKPFTLIPQHLANPWPGYQKAKAEKLPNWLKGTPLVGRLLTKVCAAALTGEEIFFEDDSPLSIQARELESRLERDFGKGVDASSVLVVGDLNAPTKSSVHRELTSKLKDSFGALTRNVPVAQASIPTNCAATRNSIPRLKIDHALASRGMKTPLSQVLKLHGSDHYPLLTVVEPR
jgi:endonuclease/exonuclease/phosphatase family metal-dependent hydrolase